MHFVQDTNLHLSFLYRVHARLIYPVHVRDEFILQHQRVLDRTSNLQFKSYKRDQRDDELHH